MDTFKIVAKLINSKKAVLWNDISKFKYFTPAVK